MPSETPAASAPQDPVAALERIAYLLERSQEPTYRVRALRRAVAAVAAAGPQRVAELAATQRLTELAASLQLRPRGGVRGVCRGRHRGGDQLATRTAGPAT